MDISISILTLGMVILFCPKQVCGQCWKSKGMGKVADAVVIDVFKEADAADCIPHCENDPWCLSFHYESVMDTCYLANATKEKKVSLLCSTCEFYVSTCKGENEYEDPRRPSIDAECYFISHGTLKKSSTTVVSTHTLGSSVECRDQCDNTTGCRGAKYITASQSCELYDEVVVAAQYLCTTCILMEKVCPIAPSSAVTGSTAISSLLPSSAVSSPSPSVVVSTSAGADPSVDSTSLQPSSSFPSTSLSFYGTSVYSSVGPSVFSESYEISSFSSDLIGSIETTLPYSTVLLSPSTVAEASSSHSDPSAAAVVSTASSIYETTTPSSNWGQSGAIEDCDCNCTTTTVTTEELQKQLKHLRDILTVNKTKLSATIRRKYSVYDGRTSSQIIGYTGGFVIGLVLLIVSGSDILNAGTFLLNVARGKN